MRERFGNALHALMIIIAAVAIAFLSTRFGFDRDWSHAHSASLGDASVSLLHSLDAPVEVVSYARKQGNLRPVISDFIERYRRVKPDLSLRFVDPDADPNAMRSAGV
ncbi:MAG: ABC transporter, partial [Dokdonella sp.]